MGSPLLTKRPEESFDTKSSGDKTEALVQKLVRQVRSSLEASPLTDADPQNAQDVILDMEVDGVRCLLVRLMPKSARPQVFLSPREQEIARMVAEGYPNKTIAAVLDISSWTVGTHLRRVFAKLGVGSRAAMVARLLEEGLMNNQQLRHAELDALWRK
ncbi:MAG TPA: LuxR C-terminal-related transcriptional regulator [Pyrinomonadaceae bacterium]|jgi:DNA-binding CsgD family transcriptional regulator